MGEAHTIQNGRPTSDRERLERTGIPGQCVFVCPLHCQRGTRSSQFNRRKGGLGIWMQSCPTSHTQLAARRKEVESE